MSKTNSGRRLMLAKPARWMRALYGNPALRDRLGAAGSATPKPQNPKTPKPLIKLN